MIARNWNKFVRNKEKIDELLFSCRELNAE